MIRSFRCRETAGLSDKYWIGLQSDCDLEAARQDLGNRLEYEAGTYAGRIADQGDL
jgi:hypothetical protein